VAGFFNLSESQLSTREIPHLVSRLYQLVDELETLFPGRHFTPDGHLVGSLGEVWAAHLYGLTLAPASQRGFDGICPAGRQVQVKATQGDSVALSSNPDWLIVLKLGRDGNALEIYNGPGGRAWAACGKIGKNGQCRISLNKLRKLMLTIPQDSRIPIVAG